MRTALVFGGSGQIGAALLSRLHAASWQVHAVSRKAQPEPGLPGVQWLRGDLEHVGGLPPRVDAVFSCGPLDAFARWYATSAIEAPRVVAFGSTSVEVKQDSADAHERDVAARLQAAEAAIFAAAAERGARATLLRPTLVYGAGRDHTLTRIARLAQRWGRFALPRTATGLRQPVHVDDLADAALGAVDTAATYGLTYALPGGETLPYREMVERVLATLTPRPRLQVLPAPLFAVAVLGLRMLGKGSGFGPAAVARMRADLVFDSAPAQRDFGFAPRPFRPTAAMFSPD